MKNIIFLWLSILVIGVRVLSAQSLYIGPGANFYLDAGANLSLKGDLNIQNSDGISGSGTMVLNGTTPQTITSTALRNLQNITLNNSSGIIFSGDIKINGNLDIAANTNVTFGNNTQLSVGGNLNNSGAVINTTNLSLSLIGAGNQTVNSKKISLTNLNFSGGGIKTLSDTVLIFGVVTGSGSANSLNANAKLILKSNDTNTARVAALPTGVSISGIYTMERFIPAIRRFRFMASPVVGGTALQWRNNANNTPGQGTQITGTGGASNGFDPSTSNNPSAFSYNETTGNPSSLNNDPGWTPFTSGGMDLVNGEGYRILVRGDRTLDLTANPAPAANATTFSISGSYPTGSFTKSLSLTGSSGWHLVGNPYPSPISWNAISKTSLSSSYYVWNPTSNAYLSYNGTTGLAGDVIHTSQAFFVKALSNPASISIEESDKVSGTGGFFGKSQLMNHLKITLMYDSSNYDAAFLHFRADAQDEQDLWDASKMSNPNVNICFVSADKFRQSIASYGAMTLDEIIVPISAARSTPSALYKLYIEGANSFELYKPYLQDKVKGTLTLIGEDYSQAISLADSSLLAEGRLALVFKKIANATQQLEAKPIFFMYPNPAKENIQLAFDGSYLHADKIVEVLDIHGKRVLNFSINKGTSIFPLSILELASGLYHIIIHSNAGITHEKFIKQ